MARLFAQLLVWFLAVWMPVHAAAAPLTIGHCEKPLARDLHVHAIDAGPEHVHAGHAAADEVGGQDRSIAPDDDARFSASGDRFCCFHLSGFVSVTCPLTVSFEKSRLP